MIKTAELGGSADRRDRILIASGEHVGIKDVLQL